MTTTILAHAKSWRSWLRGLIAAFIGGAANAITNVIVAPETFNFQNGKAKLATAALVSGLFMAAAYLKQSPIPPEDSEPEKSTNATDPK